MTFSGTRQEVVTGTKPGNSGLSGNVCQKGRCPFMCHNCGIQMHKRQERQNKDSGGEQEEFRGFEELSFKEQSQEDEEYSRRMARKVSEYLGDNVVGKLKKRSRAGKVKESEDLTSLVVRSGYVDSMKESEEQEKPEGGGKTSRGGTNRGYNETRRNSVQRNRRSNLTVRPIADARQRIIQNTREKMTDARDKLAEIAKQSFVLLKFWLVTACKTCLSEASIRGMRSTKDGLNRYNYQCNTVSVMKNFIKKGHGAHKLYLARLEEEEN
uniref:Uncharacterized protein n=1 Tax=Timema tahoe TaxID=61484 RepID=A0A7R9NV08_9NEOP|nr:unnamed protein product [Timema tahoe]